MKTLRLLQAAEDSGPLHLPLQGLYADLSDNQVLTLIDELDAPQLLDRYNVAQAQALLYRCSEMRL